MATYLILAALCVAYDSFYLVHNIKRHNAYGIVGTVVLMVLLISLSVVYYVAHI